MRNSSGAEFDVSDVDAARMSAADPSLKVVGDVALAPDEAGSAPVSVDAGQLGRTGAQAATAGQSAAYEHKEYLKGKTSLPGAIVRQGLGGLSLGLSDKLFSDTSLEADQAIHPIISTGAQLGGALLPGLFGDEAGIGAALARDGAATERVAGSLSSKFLTAGELGGEHAGAGLERALAGAGEHMDRVKAVANLPEEFAGLDAAGLRAAEKGEVDSLVAQHSASKVAQRSAVIDDVKAYQAQFQEANPHLVMSEGDSYAPFWKAGKRVDKAFDNELAIRRNPGKLLDSLEIQGQAIEETIGEREAIAAKFEKANGSIAKNLEEDLATLPDTATHVELTGKAAKRYGAYADVKVAGRNPVIQVARDDAQEFLGAMKRGDVSGAGQQSLAKLDGLLDANKALRAKIQGAMAKDLERGALSSDRLTAIQGARDALSSPKSEGLLKGLLGGTVMGHVAGALSGLPIIGPAIGAKAGQVVSDLVFNRLGKTAAAGAAKTSDAVSAFLSVAKRATPTLPVAATRILSNAAFGPRGKDEPKDLAGLYKARTSELKAQTAYAPDGSVQMRPEAREAMAARLAPLKASSPILADRIETIAAAKLAFLSSIMPRKPDIHGIPTGPDHWTPSDLQMRSWARSVSAAEDPHGVEERLVHGTVTPEDAAAYHAIYPERAEALKQQILTELPKLQKSLPYARRLSLSIFSGVAVDPAMDPAILRVLQSGFANDDGSPMTNAPMPSPQFGSVKNDVGTLSQQREAGTR
jgi:hypothetical protein